MAARYWVGGTGTWSAVNTANWSTTTGGASGASVPTSVDSPIFDANSGGGTVTLNYTPTIINIDFRGFAGTFNFDTYEINANRNGGVIVQQDGTSSMSGTKTINLTYAGAVGTRTLGMLTVIEANALNINVIAGTDIVTNSTNNICGNLNFTGFSGTLSNVARTIFGSLTISSGMTVTAGANATTFAATSGTQQITTNGKTLDHPITQNSPGATVQLQDNLTIGSTRTFTLTAGTLDLTGNSGNWTLSTGLFSGSNSNTRSIAFGTGNITVTGNGATIFTMGIVTNFTYTGTPTVNCTYAGGTGTRTIGFQTVDSSEAKVLNFNISAGSDIVSFTGTGGAAKNINLTGFTGTINIPASKIIYGSWDSGSATAFTGTFLVTFAATSGTQTIRSGGLTWSTSLAFNGIGGTWACQDALTQDSTRPFTITEGTVQLKNGVTSTVGAFATSSTNQKFLQSTTPGSQATLSQASGTVDASYLTIRDINATGGATWNAFVDQSNIDAGNNDGWNFGISPVIGGAEYTYQLRSFTQPRRF